MSTQSKLVRRIKSFLPPLESTLHKGQAGRIGVIGGSEDYTGAPYFAGISALKTGADLSHVFCEKDAGLVIKGYSPELMVHPYMRLSSHVDANNKEQELSNVTARIEELLPRLHVLVVGPGLSRDDLMQETARQILVKAREKGMPFVIDADGLYLVQKHPSTVQGYPLAVLTPNVNEFKRLCEAMEIPDSIQNDEERARKLSIALGNVTILLKGSVDIVTNGTDRKDCPLRSVTSRLLRQRFTVYVCDAPGSPRRCGGQGDLLSGACATFLAWALNFAAKTTRYQGDTPQSPILCCYAAALLIRGCSRAAFHVDGRATVTSGMIDHIGPTFKQLFEND
ncbi:Ribokinase-like protein [Phlyctochytrium arcticum]|nr:Ribokinase-like protein [Phlyctochytrium arcticum]